MITPTPVHGPALGVTAFFQARNITVEALLAADLGNPHPLLEYLEHLIQLDQQRVSGAAELLVSIAGVKNSIPECERIYYNLLTEAMAAHFVSVRLGGRVVEIESSRRKVQSPFRRSLDASCDIKAEIKGEETYVEVKDFSGDQLRAQNSGVTGFTPKTNGEKRAWLEEKVRQSLAKGASYLIARVSTWRRTAGNTAVEESIKEVLVDYAEVAPDHVRVALSYPLPEWFKGIYLVKRVGCVFVEPR